MEREYRLRQKGVECSVEGCGNWCVSMDLCSKHGNAFRRYGNVLGKEAIGRECIVCGVIFKSIRDVARYCSPGCGRVYNKDRAYEATKRYRLRHLEKVRAVGTSGRRRRRRGEKREVCSIEGCDIIGEAHHPDYRKVHEVVWLCKVHHEEFHTGKTHCPYGHSYEVYRVRLKSGSYICRECNRIRSLEYSHKQDIRKIPFKYKLEDRVIMHRGHIG